ncbi:solute carrier family 35 member G1-like [Limulus polyphemus]|uniref:Solute carrier family 35 member G1-like n=1 Tax=Limulus polyphemus TaxID=6850 RepID=A0ABM1RUV3_LIMPO|nr:solute carrier family 35 member G1-like [Limulus polyphemus]XP_022235159.1 solute carrier family 35 member G1-like [Limulus polyphemus]XP_022235160.1 solute carrier family 35 member G1-like [Limulus polyphemus]
MDRGRIYYGFGLIVFTGFLFALTGVLVQFTKDRIFMDVMGLSQVVRIIIISPLVVFKNVKFNYERRTILLTSLRCLTGALGDTFLYYSYTLLPVGDATAIYSTNPVFSNVFSVFIFKRSCKWPNFVSSLLCIFGVVIISQPSFLFASDKHLCLNYKGIVAVIAASILDSLSINFNNLLSNVNYMFITTCLSINTIILWVICLISDKRLPVLGYADCSWTNLYISAIGLAGLLTVLACTRGFQLVDAGPGSVALCSIVVFGYIFQLLTRAFSIRVESIVGAVLIIVAILISSSNSFYERNTKPEDINQSVNCKENPSNFTFQKATDSSEEQSLIEKD